MNNSIGVPQARRRWARLSGRIDPEDIRSAFFESARNGVHPEERGTYILKVLERLHDAGLPSRKSKKKVWTESEFRARGDDGGQSIFDLDIANAATDSPVEEEVLRSIGGSAADSRMHALAAIADEEELALLRALEDGWRADPSKSVAEIARHKGWMPKDAEAVRKRLKRKAERLINPT